MNDPRRGATSASNAAADAACPGRHLAQRGMPERVSQDSESGRAVHEALSGKEVKLTPEQIETKEACQRIEEKVVGQFFGTESGRMVPKVFREERFWVQIPVVGGNSVICEHSGQPDVVMRAGPKALIIEYKTLFGDVPESPENLQLRDQAVLARGKLLVKEIGVVVIQPHVTHQPVLCMYDEGAITRAAQEMFARVVASNNPNSQRHPGEQQCKFCLAKRNCAPYQAWAGGMVPGMLSVLDVPVALWTPEQRGQFCEMRATAQRWLDECVDACKDELEKDPEAVAGWKLRPGSKRDTITDPQGVFDRFAALGGTPAQFLSAVSVVKTNLKRALGEITGAKGKALNDAMETLTEGLVETKMASPTLERKETK